VTSLFVQNLAAAFDEVVQRATAALKEEGFGVLTDIDVQATLKVRLTATVTVTVSGRIDEMRVSVRTSKGNR
jgi:uncharacterized protein (DUF302 family)